MDVAGDPDDGADPNTLEIIASDSVISAAGGFDHIVFIRSGGAVSLLSPHAKPTDGSHFVSVPFSVPIASVAAGEHHSIFLSEIGDVFCAGSNKDGQLGTPTAHAAMHEPHSTPVLVLGPSVNRGPTVVAIAAGARHNMVATEQGRCMTWGSNLRGQCGTGSTSVSVSSPYVIESLGPLTVTAVAAGMSHSLCMSDSGDVYAWGSNSDGQLGLMMPRSERPSDPAEEEDIAEPYSMVPALVEAPGLDDERVIKISAGARHSVALCESGAAYSWGYGQFGALGDGTRGNQVVPQKMGVDKKVVDIAAGWWHTLLVVD